MRPMNTVDTKCPYIGYYKLGLLGGHTERGIPYSIFVTTVQIVNSKRLWDLKQFDLT